MNFILKRRNADSTYGNEKTTKAVLELVHNLRLSDFPEGMTVMEAQRLSVYCVLWDKSQKPPPRRLEWVVTATSCLDSSDYPFRRVSWFG